jgi:hypothetical protein
MGEPVHVPAGWAIWSKRAGTRDDYAVLASSTGPLSTAEFGRVLAHFAPGNPPAEGGTSASLPWVMLSRVGIAGQTYLGASLQVSTEDVDATGRPISRTFYLCVPFDDVARTPVSYHGLWQALTSAQLPYPDGAPVPLTIPGLDPGELARAVQEFGPNVVATTAALVLSGPVTITGPEFPDTETRLRFLDAVAALLPYGYRASYTATTWSDTAASEQRFRVVFAHRARDDASRVTWRAAARVPDDGPVRTYLEYLRRVADGPAADVAKLTKLIGFLSRDVTPRKFEHPEQAVACLEEFFRADVVGESIDAGTATPAAIRLLFSRGQDGEMSASRLRIAFGLLISAGDARDWRLIEQRFGAIAGNEAQDLLTAVALPCRRQLWSAASKDLVRRYLDLVAPYGLIDDLLARLLVSPKSEAELGQGLDAAAALLADYVMASPASYPRTQRALTHNVAVGPALLAHLCAARKTEVLGAAVEWLEPVLDRILLPFNAVLGQAVGGGVGVTPEPVGADAIAELDRDGGQHSVRYLLRAASYLRRLSLVLPGLTPVLAWRALTPGSLDPRFWGEVAMELTPTDAADGAWLDLVLLATGNDPRSLFAGTFRQRDFNRDLVAAWREMISQLQFRSDLGQAADVLLTDALIGFLGRHRWRGDQARAAAVADLVGLLTADGARPRLKAAVLDPLEALRQLPRQVTVTQIAQACVRAYVGGLAADEAGAALAKSGAVTSGQRAGEVLEQLHRELAADRSERCYTWQWQLAVGFTNGALGPEVMAGLPPCMVRNAQAEIGHHLNLIAIATKINVEGAPPALSDADVEYLGSLYDLLQDILNARKRQGKRLIGLNLSGRKDARGADE